MRQYDEEGTTFNVEQYHYTLGNPMMSYEQIVHKTGLTKEEAWNVFKEAAIKAYKYNDKAIPSYGSVKDYIGYPVVSTEISTIYGNTKTKYPTRDDREIVNNISFQKEEGTYTSWKELCQKFLDRAEESFFKGEYEYTSY